MKQFLSLSKMLLVYMLAVYATNVQAQNPSLKVFEDWSASSGSQNNFQRSIVRTKAIAGTTFYYTCGSTLNSSGNYDLLIQKKNASGTVLWSQTYNGSGNGNDYAADVQVSSGGSVYVCGTYYKNSTDSNNAIILKYNNSGTQQWAYTFNGAGSRHDVLAAIQLSANAVVGVGTTYQGSTNLYDMLAIRIDTNGNQVWAQTWDHLNLNDGAVNLWNSGTKVYIAGGAQSAITTYKYAVFNVKFSDGSIQGSTVTGGTAFGFDQLTDIQYDQSGYIYLTGGVMNTGTVYDIKTVKLDSALNIIWSATYASSGAYNDVGTGLAVDQVGNVIVTGYRTTATTGKDYVTIKYSSGGAQRWVSTYDGGVNADDSATCVVVSPTDTNKIYVSGFSYNGSSKDYWTMKYDGAGNQKWEIGFNNIYNTDDRATAIALDTVGNVLVAGQNKLNDSTHIYTTVRYIEKNLVSHDDTVALVSTSFSFAQNRGQLLGTDTNQHPEVKYYTIQSVPLIYFMDTAVSYVFGKYDTTLGAIDSLVRMDMKFVNSNSNQRIRSLKQNEDFSNFYTPHTPEGCERVPNYGELVSFNVWNNVDIIYGSNSRGLKYYFICKAGGGGNPAGLIDLYYNGADSVKIDPSGQLIICTRFGNVVQPKASAWQIDANGNFLSLGWQPNYMLLGANEIGFTNFGTYNTALTLVIAVDWGNIQFSTVTNPRWSTYFGGLSDDVGCDIKSNISNDDVFITGQTYSTNFPQHVAYDGSLGGSTDAFFGCFKPDRSRRWVTYFGGSGFELGAQLEIGTNAMLYGVGNTYSSDFPILFTAGAYHEATSATTSTAYVVKLLQNTGVATWSTRFGINNTSGSAIALDVNNNVFITGATTNSTTGNPTCAAPSNSGFPLCDPGGGAYYDNSFSSSSGSADDAFIAKFSSNGQILWSTYYGGAGIDKGYDLFITSSGTLYLVGTTTTSLGSNNPCATPTNNGFPLCAPNNGTYFQANYSGGIDGYLSEFNASLQLTWSTFVGGSDDEIISSVIVAGSGSVYIGGITTTSSPDATTCDTPTAGGFPNCNANSSYTQNYMTGGGSDAFILRFKSENLIWGTYLGGDGQDGYFGGASSLPVLSYDASGNVYVAITSFTPNSSTNAPAVTQYNSGMNYNVNNNHDVANGNYAYSEVLLYTFTHDNLMLWGTYFGGAGALTVTVPDYGEMAFGIHCGTSSFFITGLLFTTSGFPVVAPATSSYTLGPTWVSPTPGGGDAFITEFDITQVLVSTENEQRTNETSINVFPNPASGGTINLVLHSESTGILTVRIIDAVGNVVSEQMCSSVAGGYTPIDISFLTSGIYFVQVLGEDGSTNSEKFVIQE